MGAPNRSGKSAMGAAGGLAVVLSGCALAQAAQPPPGRSIQVSGTGTDLLNGAIVHSRTESPQGAVQRSTEIVELRGDLTGKVLYDVTSTLDVAKGMLVNTGDQVFSGVVAGSEPVLIHDSKFRFEINLKTGADMGEVFLTDHLAGPPVACSLHVVGTGKDAASNPTFRYTGTCTFGPPSSPAQ